VDVLVAQGLAQFYLWTETRPPAAAMAAAVHAAYDASEPTPP
jgi:shikimate 5-dehydrogenase